MLVPTNYKNFLQYPTEAFIPYIRSQVWDRYFQDRLKSETRNSQGQERAQKFSVMKKYQKTGRHLSVAVTIRMNYLHFLNLANQWVDHQSTKLLLLQKTKWLFQTMIFI